MGKSLEDSFTDLIGIKIIANNNEDCYKILNLILQKYTLQKLSGLDNPEDFFKNPKQMRQTNSVTTNQIYIKIFYKNSLVHIMIQPKWHINQIEKDRSEYIKSTLDIINKNKNIIIN
jgi:hypothetical protein